MRKILSAEIYRCRCSILFWLMLFASVISGAFYGFISRSGSFDDMFVVPLFVIIAIFISVNMGTEYSDKTVRNKIITGHTKTAILLSKLVLGVGTGVLFCAAFLIPCAVVLSASVLSKMPASVLFWTAIGFVLLTVVWAVLFTVVSTLISAKGLGGIVNFALIIAIMFLSYQLEFLAGQPEFIYRTEASSVQMTPEEVAQVQEGTFEGSYGNKIDDNGQVTYYKDVITNTEQTPNPNYIKEPFRSLLTPLDSMLPHGQINEYVSRLTECAYLNRQTGGIPENIRTDGYPRLKAFPLYSCFDILLLSGIGLILFRKKEIR